MLSDGGALYGESACGYQRRFVKVHHLTPILPLTMQPDPEYRQKQLTKNRTPPHDLSDHKAARGTQKRQSARVSDED